MPLLVRATCCSLALVVCAWFALAIPQARDIDQATAIVSGLTGQSNLSPAQAQRARSLLSSAGVLNPDSQVDVLRARVDLLRNDRASARRILLGVVVQEPMNVSAWYGLATSAKDGATVTLALAHIAELQPKVRSAP